MIGPSPPPIAADTTKDAEPSRASPNNESLIQDVAQPAATARNDKLTVVGPDLPPQGQQVQGTITSKKRVRTIGPGPARPEQSVVSNPSREQGPGGAPTKKSKLSAEEIEELKLASQVTLDPHLLRIGREAATIRDRINDPGRESWEDFRKNKLDKLRVNDKEMVEYRKQLDAEREERLQGRNKVDISKKKSKKKKSRKKRKRRYRSGSDSSDTESDDSDNSRRKRSRKSKKHHRSKKDHKRNRHRRRSRSRSASAR